MNYYIGSIMVGGEGQLTSSLLDLLLGSMGVAGFPQFCLVLGLQKAGSAKVCPAPPIPKVRA